LAAVQTTTVDINIGTNGGTSAAFGASVTAGRAIMVGITTWNSGTSVTISSVQRSTDSFSQVATIDIGDNTISIWKAENVSAGTTAVQVTTSGTCDCTVAATEVSNVPTSGTADASNTATANNNDPTVSVTTVDSAPQMFGCFGHDQGDRTLTADGSYTMLAENEGGSSDMPIAWMYQLFASNGAKTVDGTIGLTGGTWGIVGASLKSQAEGGGAATPVRLRRMTVMGVG
jgi:hypothetical protein